LEELLWCYNLEVIYLMLKTILSSIK
jgi:hypothetical protein